MNGDWPFLVFLVSSFILFIIAAALEHNAASLLENYRADDEKINSAASLMQINAGLGLGIGISGLLVSLIAMIMLAFVPIVLAISGLFPVKMLFKVLFGVILIALGVSAIIICSVITRKIENSSIFESEDPVVSRDVALAYDYNQMAFGLFIGLTVFIFILFLGMALYDFRKAKQNVENLVNETVMEILKMSEGTFRKVKSHYDGEKFAHDDTLEVNKVGAMMDTGIEKIEELVDKNKLKSKMKSYNRTRGTRNR